VGGLPPNANPSVFGPYANLPPGSLQRIPDPNPVVPGGPWTPHNAPGVRPGNFLGPKQATGGRGQVQWVPPEGEGGPLGSKGYWKTNRPGQKGWDRYDEKGNPISPEEAHPGNLPGDEASLVAGGITFGTILYWVISEGSRVVFPPRNLVPVP